MGSNTILFWHIVVCSIISILIVLFIWSLIRGLRKTRILSEISIGHSIIALGITTYFFSSTLHVTIRNLGLYFRDLWGSYGNGETNNFLNYWLLTAGESFTTHFLDIPFTRLILYIASWLFVCLIFGELKRADNLENTSTASITKIDDNPVLKSLLTFLILATSIYLCVASIIAVPEFEKLRNSENKTENRVPFSEKLTARSIMDRANYKLYTDDMAIDTTQELGKSLYEKVDIEIYNFNNWLDGKIKAHNSTVLRLSERIENEISQNISNTELIKYERILSDWYENYQYRLIQIVDEERDEILRALDNLIVKYNELILVDPQSESYADLKGSFMRYEGVLARYRISSSLYGIPSDIPPRPKIGQDFGFFSQISGWLLKTESPSLALIVGLFGFGLLGSMSSVFIRRRINMKDEDLILADIPGVLINGMSAAILVFLVVKGAIVIFGDGGELNPYALFFSCLVASVFSENVWIWARNKQKEQFLQNPTPE